MRGECLACERINRCEVVTVEKVKQGYTCHLFSPVEEPVFQARLATIAMYGENTAIDAMMDKPKEENDDL